MDAWVGRQRFFIVARFSPFACYLNSLMISRNWKCAQRGNKGELGVWGPLPMHTAEHENHFTSMSTNRRCNWAKKNGVAYVQTAYGKHENRERLLMLFLFNFLFSLVLHLFRARHFSLLHNPPPHGPSTHLRLLIKFMSMENAFGLVATNTNIFFFLLLLLL